MTTGIATIVQLFGIAVFEVWEVESTHEREFSTHTHVSDDMKPT